MSYEEDRGKFIEMMRGYGMPEVEAKWILRQATTIQRLAVKECNEPLTEKERRRWQHARKEIEKYAILHGIKPNFNGDPRGYMTKLILPDGRSNTMGDPADGWGIPYRSRY